MTKGYPWFFFDVSFLHIILYDGKCAMCNQIVLFVLPRDKKSKFGFASLQSKFAHDLLSKYDRNADDLNTFYLVKDYGMSSEKLLSRASGGVFVLSHLDGAYFFVNLLRAIPMPLLNMLYGVIARNRYSWFGQYETCRMPEPQWQTRFLDAHEIASVDDVPVS